MTFAPQITGRFEAAMGGEVPAPQPAQTQPKREAGIAKRCAFKLRLWETIMDLAKCGAAAFVAGCLGFQLYAIIPPTRSTHYWPFIDYPMYSESHKPGASFSDTDFRILPCGSDTARTASAQELGIQWYNMVLLQDAVIGKPTYGGALEAPPDSAARQFAAIIHHRIRQPVCEAQIWGRTFTIGIHGLESATVPWRMLRRWSTEPGTTGEMLPTGSAQP